jgi:uncharacterized protein (TIGR03382 family)
VDATTWQAVGVTLSAVGLVLSVLVWRRRGAAAGLRAVAWSLLPAAAGLTGTLRLLWRIADEVGSWAVRLVFSPVVWLGIVLAGIAVVLFVVSAALRSRGAGRKRTDKAEPEQPRQVAARRDSSAGLDDDVEAILRKHGIS